MKTEINFEVYKQSKIIHLLPFIILTLLYKKEYEVIDKYFRNESYNSMINSLEKDLWIKINGYNNIQDAQCRQKTIDLFNRYEDKNTASEEWIAKWRELFPKGLNSNGYRYRGNSLECTKKMSKFARLYKYTQKEIFKATNNYITRCQNNNSYMLQAHFFIDKLGVGSTLLTECEHLEDNEDVIDSNINTKNINTML